MHDFDKNYWEAQWAQGASVEPGGQPLPANLYLVTLAQRLDPGRALDAGCGTGAEAVWLAEQGWRVTGADISAAALASADQRGRSAGVADRVDWAEADLTTWQPPGQYDLVSTNYAHAAIPQLHLYQRLAQWVAPGGTILIVGHLHEPGGGESGRHDSAHTGHHPQHPEAATVTVQAVADLFDSASWCIDQAQEHIRAASAHGREAELRDAVVSATRLP